MTHSNQVLLSVFVTSPQIIPKYPLLAATLPGTTDEMTKEHSLTQSFVCPMLKRHFFVDGTCVFTIKDKNVAYAKD